MALVHTVKREFIVVEARIDARPKILDLELHNSSSGFDTSFVTGDPASMRIRFSAPIECLFLFAR